MISDEDRITLGLKEGRNHLLIKVEHLRISLKLKHLIIYIKVLIFVRI